MKFANTAWDTMRRHGEQSYPHECCGVLLGHTIADGERLAVEAVPCRNARTDSPESRYSIDPRDLIRIQLDSREDGLEILGFYHSHPDHPPEASPTDLAEAYWFGCSYVITSVLNGRADETRSFLLRGHGDEKQLEEEQLGLGEPSQRSVRM